MWRRARGRPQDASGLAVRRSHSPSQVYQSQVGALGLSDDPHQRRALVVLDRIWREVEAEPRDVRPRASASPWWVPSVLRRSRESPVTLAESGSRPHAYLHGTVGTGKSFLMDLFYDCVTDPRKKRVHFNAFMLDVHAKIHRWRQHERQAVDDDPITPVAEKIRREASVLCFDEFQVTDVADAMILKRLFEAMLARGIRVVATSNREPRELYKGGLSRPLFEPFITGVLEKHFEVVNLSSSTDYRLVGAAGSMKVYLVESDFPSPSDAVALLRADFRKLSHNERIVTNFALPIASLDRTVTVPESARGVCFFTFDQLCRHPLGAADYLAIARSFHTVVVAGVPKLDLRENAVARRFILFIDSLYETRTKLLCTAAAPPTELFPTFTDGSAEEEVFAFRRTASRLVEMQSAQYLQTSHRGVAG